MRGKRSKQYRKLMHQYATHFGFREPYQVLLDAEILQVAARSKMNFISLLSSTLHGEIKPMITQCCMRHLYDAEPKDEMVIEHAKNFEKRRCNHHTLEKPLSALECLSSVIDPNGTKTNKHRYVVACQDAKVQQYLQSIPGVPMIYIVRSVMIMKPMSDVTAQVTSREEQAKLSSGIRKSQQLTQPTKKRTAPQEEENESGGLISEADEAIGEQNVVTAAPVNGPPKKKKRRKGPNPLSVMKSKSKFPMVEQAPKKSGGATRRKR